MREATRRNRRDDGAVRSIMWGPFGGEDETDLARRELKPARGRGTPPVPEPSVDPGLQGPDLDRPGGRTLDLARPAVLASVGSRSRGRSSRPVSEASRGLHRHRADIDDRPDDCSEIQHRHGWLPERELQRAVRGGSATPLHRIHEVASFFPHYRLERGAEGPRGGLPRHGLPPPRGPGAGAGVGAVRRRGSAAEEVEVAGVSCLGQCDSPPALAINDACFWGVSASQARARVRAALLAETALHQQRADRSPLGWQIDIYDGQPRYEAVRFLAADVEGGPVARAAAVNQVIEAAQGLRSSAGWAAPGSPPT